MQKHPQIQDQQDNNYYLHTQQHPHCQRSIIKSFHAYQNGIHHHLIAIVNHNSLQIYRKVRTRVFYDCSYDFMCDITVLQVLPVKGQNTDVLFIADCLGRYLFWQPKVGSIAVSNVIRAPQYLAPVYQRVLIQQRQVQYSGISANFSALDTEAVIFFTVSTKIIIMRVKYSKNKIMFVSPPVQVTCPYLDINYIGIINGKEPYIGIIEQRQQKSFIRFHKSTSQNFQCVLTFQKSNLQSFYSSLEGQQIITVTNNQLSIFNIKTQQIFCTFSIPQSGHVSILDQDLYIYVGQIATQMIVFSKKHYKNYGGFMLENFVCMRLNGHGKMDDGGYLISVIDQGHTVQFLGLYEQNWKSVHTITSSSSIFMLEDLNRRNQVLAIRGSQNNFQVGILSKHISSKLQKQTTLKSIAQSLFSVNSGKSLILSTYQTNTVFTYSEQHQNFQHNFQFQSGTIIKVIDKYVIMQYKIYQMDLNKSKIKELCNDAVGIVSADFDGKFIAYQCNDLNLKFYNTQTKEIDRIKKSCYDDYIWKFYNKEILLVASLDLRGKMKIVPVFKQTTIVSLHNSEIIVDMTCHQNLVIISFSNCFLQIYDFNNWSLVQKIDSSAQPLQLIYCHDKILAYSVKQCYLIKLNYQGNKSKTQRIQFDQTKQIISIAYLHNLQKFSIAHPDNISLYSINYNKPQNTSSFKVISDCLDINPPFATQKNKVIYIVQNYQLLTKDKDTGQLLKKQSHGLKQICCIEKLQSGLLVCGVNDMDSAQIFLFDYHDLQILVAEPLHKVQAFDKKFPTAIKKAGINQFFLREDQTISLYEVRPDQLIIKQVFSTKVGIKGYSLSVHNELSMVIASDPLRYLVAYDYRLRKLVSLCRYQNLNTINDIQFIRNSVVTGDSIGNITIAQFNFESGEAARTMMTDVGSLNIGSQISHITKGISSVVYSTISGSIGRLRTLNAQTFNILKQAQKQILLYLDSNKHQLKYQEWAMRPSLSDKLIDGLLIQNYLQKIVKNKNQYVHFVKLWEEINKYK